MSEESIKEVFSNKEKNYGFLPEFNLSFISDIKSQMNAIMNQQILMMNAINSMINEKINSIQDNYLLLTQTIEESNEKIDKIIKGNCKTNEIIEKVTTKNDKITNDIANISRKIEESNEKIDKIITENSKTKNDIDNFSQKVESNIKKLITEKNKTNEKIDKILTKNDIGILSQKIDESNEKIGNISQNVGNIERKVNETFTKVDENSREANDIKEKIEFIKRKSSEIETKIAEGNEKSNDKAANLSQKIEESNNRIHNLSLKSIEMLKISIDAINGRFNGIIRHLTNECGGNVLDKGIVNVTASSTSWGTLRNLVNLDDNEEFGTNGSRSNPWIKYDFKDKKVSPICYLIKTCDYDEKFCHPKSWVVEGSNTDSYNDWKILDSIKNCKPLKSRCAVQCFTIQQSSDFYRFLRIRQTDENWYGGFRFCMSSLEYFGFIQ